MKFTSFRNYNLINWWWSVTFCLFIWWCNSKIILQKFDTGKPRIWTRISYHPYITSEPWFLWLLVNIHKLSAKSQSFSIYFLWKFISEKDFSWIHVLVKIFNLVDSTLENVSEILITCQHLFRGKCDKCRGLTMCNE